MKKTIFFITCVSIVSMAEAAYLTDEMLLTNCVNLKPRIRFDNLDNEAELYYYFFYQNDSFVKLEKFYKPTDILHLPEPYATYFKKGNYVIDGNFGISKDSSTHQLKKLGALVLGTHDKNVLFKLRLALFKKAIK